MRRAVLIFGVFNPITNAHIDMGLCARRKYPDADIIYVPTNQRYIEMSKKTTYTEIPSVDTRLQLLEDAIQEYGFTMSAIEAEGVVDGKTYNSAEYFNHLYDHVVICLGSDKLEDLGHWYNKLRLVRDYSFLIVIRNGHRGEIPYDLLSYKDHFRYIEGSWQNTSSTLIRNACKSGNLQKVKTHVPNNVYEYLKNHPQLYT